MWMLVCPAHFRPLARLLRARHAVRLEFVSGCRPPLPSGLDLSLEFDLPGAVALPLMLPCLFVAGALLEDLDDSK